MERDRRRSRGRNSVRGYHVPLLHRQQVRRIPHRTSHDRYPPHQDIARFFGIADCTVSPPEDLFHPVLPYRCKGKITFPLCRACVEEELPRRMTDRTCANTPPLNAAFEARGAPPNFSKPSRKDTGFSAFTKCTTFPPLSVAKGCSKSTSTRGSKAKRKPPGGPRAPVAVSKRPSSNPSSCPSTSYGKASVSTGIT